MLRADVYAVNCIKYSAVADRNASTIGTATGQAQTDYPAMRPDFSENFTFWATVQVTCGIARHLRQHYLKPPYSSCVQTQGEAFSCIEMLDILFVVYRNEIIASQDKVPVTAVCQLWVVKEKRGCLKGER